MQTPDPPDGRHAAGGDPAKRQQILDGARRVFMSLGFDGASMGDIARAAGVSKGTLYVYFDSKEALFSALVAEERQLAKRDYDFALDAASEDVAGELKRYGRSFIGYVTRRENVAAVRTVMGIAERFPNVGHAFYEDGPKRGLSHLRAFIEGQAAAGRLAVADPTMAAEQLRALFYAGIFNELLFGVRSIPPEAEIAGRAEEAVKTFLARYGA